MTRRLLALAVGGLFIPLIAAAAFMSIAGNGRVHIDAGDGDGMDFFDPPGSVLYEDGFEDGTLGSAVVGGTVGWSPNVNDSVSPASAVRYSGTEARTGTKSVEFFYSCGGASTPCGGFLAELGFDLGALYKQVTIDFWVYTPDNFKHFVNPPGSGFGNAPGESNNNKTFRLGHDDPVSSGQERLGASFERVTDDISGIIGDWDTSLDGSDMTQHGTQYDNFILTAEASTWHRWTIYCEAATARDSGPAVLKIWKDGVLVIDEAPNNFITGEAHAYQYGYLLGALNGQQDGDTSYYIDDMAIWVNP